MSETKIVLITGASSGIGDAVAQELSRAGHVVVVGAHTDLAGAIGVGTGHFEEARIRLASAREVCESFFI
jgi:NAD(P)-dependent dehydrogenase (short-subunit alcohol dehydrogenase family)